MPTYAFVCQECGWAGDMQIAVQYRDNATCPQCFGAPRRLVSAPLVKQKNPKGGGPDRLTADMLGIPLKELPPGLRTPVTQE